MKVHHKEMMAIFRYDQGEMKAYSEKMEANPEETEFKEEHWEVPKDHAVVETSKALNKWHRGRNLAASRRMGPGENCLPPAEGSPAVQKWHGARERREKSDQGSGTRNLD
jgi:hypothetical protein